ncbi:unnamed protein product [Diabrotica balteata]|uniref:Cytochrome P450 n=1 Tax=Diabrotica balteata TaxID=107213 RepID=A0A9N9T5G2_DIABA|nr:unnamed protein product [Diabrotica balteata]
MDILTVLLYTTVVTLSLYLCLKWNYSYWSRIGLEYLKPLYFFGNTISLLHGVSMGDTFKNIYNDMKAKGFKHGGLFFFFLPLYMPVDLDIVKNVLQNNFEHFMNHGIYHDEEREPITAHLFSLENDRWRMLRKKLSQTFTSGKIKMMYPTLFSCSAGIKDRLQKHAELQDAVDIKDLFMRFTIDVISSVAFGLNSNSLEENESEIIDIAYKMFDAVSPRERLKEAAIFLFPKRFLKAINFKFMNANIENFFYGMVGGTVKYREANNIYRKDFMHLLLQLKNRGKLSDDKRIISEEGEQIGEDFISFNELVAQCFVFFTAGFETSATTLSFAMLELALNPDIQEKLREEIITVLEDHDGELSYEAVMKMEYAEKVIFETLRKHPPGPVIPRICTKDYNVPNTNITITKGTRVVIPGLAIHNDPDIYPEPEKFDPERFSEENRAKRHPCAFLAFGEGPRYCIGSRFGILECKVALSIILSNFRIGLHQKTRLPIKYAYTNAFILGVKGGIWITVSKLNE